MLYQSKKLSGQGRTYDGINVGPALAGHGYLNGAPEILAHPSDWARVQRFVHELV